MSIENDKTIEKEVMNSLVNQLAEEYTPGKMAKWMGCSPSTMSKMRGYKDSRIPTAFEILGFCQGSGMSLLKIMHKAHSLLRLKKNDPKYAAVAKVIEENIQLVEESDISVLFNKLSEPHREVILSNLKLLAMEDSQKKKKAEGQNKK